MKVYLGFTVAGNRSSVQAAKKILGILQSMGLSSPHQPLGPGRCLGRGRCVPPQEIFARDMKWLAECDIFIAEVSGSSFGLGFETGYLLGATQKKTILSTSELWSKGSHF
jgi:nucleoside 2-deoxyribosyltransferase